MKNLFLFGILFLGLNISAISQSGSAKSIFAKNFATVWQGAQDYTLEVAEAMPEEQYGFRGDEEVMSFEEQLVHITGNLYGLTSRFIKEEQSPYQRPKAEELSKSEIIEQLKAAFVYVSAALDSMSEEEMQEAAPKFWAKEPTSKSTIFLLMRDHMTHHRAQCILFLRMNDIQPPRYRGW